MDIRLSRRWIIRRTCMKRSWSHIRTDSRFLTDDMEHSIPNLVHMIFNTFPVENVDNVPIHGEQVVNNKKVTDHHAILPTRELQKCNLEELPKGELAVLQLIANRLCVAVGDPYRYAESVIELDCGGTIFLAKGKTVLDDGWKSLEKRTVRQNLTKKSRSSLLFLLEMG